MPQQFVQHPTASSAKAVGPVLPGVGFQAGQPPMIRSTSPASENQTRSQQPADRIGRDLELVAFESESPLPQTGEFIVAGERHRMLAESLRILLPKGGIVTHGCGGGLGRLSATLRDCPTAGLLLIQPSRGLLAAVREQGLFSKLRPLAVICPNAPGRFYLREVVQTRVRGVVPAAITLDDLRKGLSELAAGRTVIHPGLMTDLRYDVRGQIELQPKDDLLSLTRRQLEVVRLTAIGCSTREIGERLGLAPKTVESHRYRAMRKLNLHDRVELTRTALSDGLLR